LKKGTEKKNMRERNTGKENKLREIGREGELKKNKKWGGCGGGGEKRIRKETKNKVMIK
jgi:hypothetical protein